MVSRCKIRNNYNVFFIIFEFLTFNKFYAISLVIFLIIQFINR